MTGSDDSLKILFAISILIFELYYKWFNVREKRYNHYYCKFHNTYNSIIGIKMKSLL